MAGFVARSVGEAGRIARKLHLRIDAAVCAAGSVVLPSFFEVACGDVGSRIFELLDREKNDWVFGGPNGGKRSAGLEGKFGAAALEA